MQESKLATHTRRLLERWRNHRTRFDLGFQCKITCDYKRTYKHFMPGYMFAG